MYVVPEARGRGLGKALVAWLLEAARDAGYNRIRLETGNRQEEALGLYKAAGFASIPCWGPYATDPKSRCFELDLEQPPGQNRRGSGGVSPRLVSPRAVMWVRCAVPCAARAACAGAGVCTTATRAGICWSCHSCRGAVTPTGAPTAPSRLRSAECRIVHP